MSNDNKELKNNELCEEKQEARQLTEEELEQVTGGLAHRSEHVIVTAVGKYEGQQ
ncbi:MAG: bacteriocin [Eubacteriales bacterium]|nr:bacteriocin [Eubacteriales bacterium]